MGPLRGYLSSRPTWLMLLLLLLLRGVIRLVMLEESWKVEV
jgi:hypothetical protein